MKLTSAIATAFLSLASLAISASAEATEVLKSRKSPCVNDLATIVAQPKDCAYDFLEKAARNVPKYRWFSQDVSTIGGQFFANNYVGLYVIDAFGKYVYGITPQGVVEDESTLESYGFSTFYDTMRTMALNLNTNYYSDVDQEYYITQNVFGDDGQYYIISVYLDKTDFINACPA